MFDDAGLPQSGGAYAAKELAPGQAEQGERRRKLMELIAAKGEPGYGTRLVDNFTMGLNRPLGGVASVLGGGSYKAGVGAEEDYIKRAEANTNPVAGAAVDILGGVASGGPVKSLVQGAAQAPSRLASLGRAMMGGAGSGAIEGAARNAESVPNALIGGGRRRCRRRRDVGCRRGPDGSPRREGRQGSRRRGHRTRRRLEGRSRTKAARSSTRSSTTRASTSRKDTPTLANRVTAVTMAKPHGFNPGRNPREWSRS